MKTQKHYQSASHLTVIKSSPVRAVPQKEPQKEMARPSKNKNGKEARKRVWTRWIIARILRDGAVFLVLLFPYLFI